MNRGGQKRVVGLLAVGFDHSDRHIRITQSDTYQVLMGSQKSHHELQKICEKIEKAVHSSGCEFTDYTPEEFVKLLEEVY